MPASPLLDGELSTFTQWWCRDPKGRLHAQKVEEPEVRKNFRDTAVQRGIKCQRLDGMWPHAHAL